VKVLLSGSHGLIGRALSADLAREATIVALARPGQRSADSVAWDPGAGTIDHQGLQAAGPFDGVVHLAGAGIGDRRWNAARRREIKDSRVRPTELLASAVAALDPPPPVFVAASAIGYYGDRGEELLTEASPPGDDFLAEVCVAWEEATAAASTADSRVVSLRTGIVLATSGGALAKQLPLFRLGLGTRLGDGSQWMSWITLRDEVTVIRRALTDANLRGPLNATAPGSVTNRTFTRVLGAALGRPTFLVAPRPALRLALGAEMANELLLTSQRVRPAILESADHPFEHPLLADALGATLAST